MPLFYFDIHDGSILVKDGEGGEFEDLDAAERAALKAAAEIGRDRLPNGDSRRIAIEVSNEHRRRMLIVTILLDVDRAVHSPGAGMDLLPLPQPSG